MPMDRICFVEDCQGAVEAKGMCPRHYRRHRAATMPRCRIDGCKNRSKTRGMCSGHYNAWNRENRPEIRPYGDPDHGTFARWKAGCRCAPCVQANSDYRAWLYRLPKSRTTRLKFLYGVEAGFYEAKLAEQGGVCAICGGFPKRAHRFHVDHDHDTGMVRGLLCQACNHALGLLRDNTDNLRAAIKYLDHYAA